MFWFALGRAHIGLGCIGKKNDLNINKLNWFNPF